MLSSPVTSFTKVLFPAPVAPITAIIKSELFAAFKIEVIVELRYERFLGIASS